jgi:hypothetical protein
MSKKAYVILPVSAALAALVGDPATTEAARSPPEAIQSTEATTASKPNFVYPQGEDLLGLLVTTQADGTVVATHTSHVSHGSHASHHSHFSSR